MNVEAFQPPLLPPELIQKIPFACGRKTIEDPEMKEARIMFITYFAGLLKENGLTPECAVITDFRGRDSRAGEHYGVTVVYAFHKLSSDVYLAFDKVKNQVTFHTPVQLYYVQSISDLPYDWD